MHAVMIDHVDGQRSADADGANGAIASGQVPCGHRAHPAIDPQLLRVAIAIAHSGRACRTLHELCGGRAAPAQRIAQRPLHLGPRDRTGEDPFDLWRAFEPLAQCIGVPDLRGLQGSEATFADQRPLDARVACIEQQCIHVLDLRTDTSPAITR